MRQIAIRRLAQSQDVNSWHYDAGTKVVVTVCHVANTLICRFTVTDALSGRVLWRELSKSEVLERTII